ncbi:MAG: hypothetical protein WCS94_22490 [Verrucomicrobiota bacterium]
MPEKPAKRYARTPENILVALGCEPTRLMKSKLKLWMSWPDFPKAGKNGRDIEQLKQWVDDNQDVFLADGKRAKLLQDGDKFSGGDLKLMRQAGSGPAGAEDATAEVMGYAGIAEVLARHFQVPVSKMDISDWCHGKRLDHGVPNFPPPKASSRFNKLEGINWFRQYKFHDPRESSTPDLFKKLETQRATGELERLEHERLMRAVERELYMEKDEVRAMLASLGSFGRDDLWQKFDADAYPKFEDGLRAAKVPEEWVTVAVTALRELNPQLLTAHHDFLESKIHEADAEVAGETKEVSP